MNPLCAATWFLLKYRQRACESDTYTVARQMRKQGVPLSVALSILVPGSARRLSQ